MKKIKDVPEIRECPVFELCSERGVGCEACLSMDINAWKGHVMEILGSWEDDEGEDSSMASTSAFVEMP